MHPKITILLVEDDPVTATLESRQLESEGYGVVLASTGEEAVAMAGEQAERLDLVLMDINLGEGIDGTEAARRILARHDLPLLFLSSHTEKEIVERTEQITNYGYVVKNSSFTVLDASIKMALKLYDAHRRIARINSDFEATNEELRQSLESLQEANERLARSEEKFSKAFRLSPDAVNINRLSDGAYLDLNEGFTRIMGYTADDVLGRSSLPGGLGIWARAEDRKRLVRELLEKQIVTNLEAEFRRKDGSLVTGLMSAHVIEIEGEKCILSMTRDISEWRGLQDSLVESQRNFRLAFEKSPIGIVLVNPDLGIRAANQAFCRMLGRDMSDLVGADIEALTHPEDMEVTREMTRQVRDGASSVSNYRKRYLRGDGGSVWTDVTIALARNAAGQPDFYVAHVLDLTETMKANDSLRETQAILASTMDCQKEIYILSLDREFRCLYRNKAYRDLKETTLGIRVEVGTNLLESADRDPFFLKAMENYRLALRGSASRTLEEHPERGVIVDAVYNPILSSEGEIIGATSFSIDVTERRRQEEELADTRNRYFDLINSMGEGFCYVDDQEVFRMVNPICGQVFGLPSEEMIGLSFLDFLDDEGRAIIEAQTKERVKGRTSEYVAPIVRRDGTRRWIRIIAAPLGKLAGSYDGASALFRDITDELAAREELKALVHSKEILLQELQHRVKNSLTIVSSLLSIAAGELSDSRAISVLEDTRSRIDSMSAIYERLYLSHSVDTIDFGEYVEGLARSIFEAFRVDPGRVALVVDVVPFELDTKRAIALGLVVTELFTNAVKYAFPGGRRGTVSLALEVADGKLRLGVADDGVGMDPELPGRSPTMGMTLIRLLVEKELGGRIMVGAGGAGTSIAVEFEF